MEFGDYKRDFGQAQGGNQANQTTLFITNGDAEETFTPSFSYYGIRYASLSGLPVRHPLPSLLLVHIPLHV